MKRLMLDHYRRWAWVLALGAVGEFALGCLIATGPGYAFEFWVFLLSMWTGALLLSFDLKRSVLRPIAVLPLTDRQVGRGWWLATVPLPAVILAALLFSGAATYCHFQPDKAFPWGPLVLTSLFTLVWLGTQFTLIFNATRGCGGNWREFFSIGFISWLTMLTFFGSMVLCHDATRNPLKAAVLLSVGALLTIVGWVRAEQFEPGRAGLYLGRIEPPNLRGRGPRLTPLELRVLPGRWRVPEGHGGIPFLLSTVSIRAVWYLVALLALMALLVQWQGRRLTEPFDLVLWTTMASFMPCWFVLLYQFLPVLQHLRLLRTLPLSTTGLAAVILALALLPLIALGALAAGVAWLALGPPAALALLNSYTFILAPAALCAAFLAWRGVGIQAYAVLLLGLVGFVVAQQWLQGRFHFLEGALSLAGPVAAAGVLLGWGLTWLALSRSRHAYRVQGNPFGGMPLGAGR